MARRSYGHRRGQPLAVLGAVMLGWIGLRAALWEQIQLPALPPAVSSAVARVLPTVAVKVPPAPAAERPVPIAPRFVTIAPAPPRLAPIPSAALPPVQPPAPEFAAEPEPFDTTRVAAAHQLAWMAGVAQLPVPRFIMERLAANRAHDVPMLPAPAQPFRSGPGKGQGWAADSWLVLRAGGAGLTPAGLPAPSYGSSQAGAVIRYHLAGADKYHATIFLRGSSAVQRPRGEEVAMGAAVRPIPGLPVVLQAELRATRQLTGTRLRPAISAVTELPRFSLRAGLSAEAYGETGYVGGPDASPFIAGQIRIEQRLANFGRGELRLGLGGWGGAQKGASRLDLGPTATLDFPVPGGQGRLSADWRLRAAGNAAPQSGPAITLSAGF